MKASLVRRAGGSLFVFAVLLMSPTSAELVGVSYAGDPPLCGPSGLIRDPRLGVTCDKAQNSAWDGVMDDLDASGTPNTSEALALRAAALYGAMQLWAGDRVRSRLPADGGLAPLQKWLTGLRAQATDSIDAALQAKYDAGRASVRCSDSVGRGGGVNDHAAPHRAGGLAGVHNGHLTDRADTQ